MTTNGRRNNNEAGATELEPVNFMTSGNVVIGSAMTSSTQKSQVIFDADLEITFLYP